MHSPTEREDYLIQIRDKLRKEGIKLWLPPFLSEFKKPSEDDIAKLARNYSSSLNIPYDICYNTLKELQVNSLENLKQKNLYKDSGMATVKVKILHQNFPPKLVTKEIRLSSSSSDLKSYIKQEVNVPNDQIKLICAGRVLNDNQALNGQGVKNGHQILAILLTNNANQLAENENQIKDLEYTKSDSRLLALDNEYMQLEDQFGNPLKIPAREKKALVVAMALHEKGKTALKRKDYSRALVFLLEADQEFRECNSQLLNSVDNYALLDLDIAWCYLCLESVAHLPEAHERLARCEAKFISTYGQNMERVISVRGVSGNEKALLMRLHLLQGIVLYYQNKRTEALALLNKVESELESLQVDDNSVIALVELGYSPIEATLGLRATRGDVNLAANYINENREKKEQGRKKAKAEALLQREKKKLGLCLDGKQYVEPRFVNILCGMGYGREAARRALRHTNNVVSDAVQYLQEHPQPTNSSAMSEQLAALIEELAPQLEEAGFDPRMARLALQRYEGDMLKAIEELVSNDGVVSGVLPSDLISTESIDRIRQQSREDERKEDALRRLREDIDVRDDDEYLLVDLNEEEAFLKRYLVLLQQTP